MRRRLLPVVVAAMVLATSAGCGSTSDDEASGEATQTTAAEAPETSASGPTAPAPDPDGPAGTLEDPFRPDVDAANLEDWDVQVGAFDPDAWPEIDAFDEFNDPPEEGNVYVMVPVTVWYTGDATGRPWDDIQTLFVDADDISYNQPTALIPDSLYDVDGLENGDSATGNVAFEVAADAVDTGFFTVSYQGANRVYFSAVPQG